MIAEDPGPVRVLATESIAGIPCRTWNRPSSPGSGSATRRPVHPFRVSGPVAGRHLEDFKRLFVEVVRVAREMGVANFGKLSVDGTKVRANASKRKAMSYGRMLEEERRLEGEIEACWIGRGRRLPEELRRREDR